MINEAASDSQPPCPCHLTLIVFALYHSDIWLKTAFNETCHIVPRVLGEDGVFFFPSSNAASTSFCFLLQNLLEFAWSFLCLLLSADFHKFASAQHLSFYIDSLKKSIWVGLQYGILKLPINLKTHP